MNRIMLKDVKDHLNEEILVQGFVENFRNGGKGGFN